MRRVERAGVRTMVAAIVAVCAIGRVDAQETSEHEHHETMHAHANANAEDRASVNARSSSTDHIAPPPPQHPMGPMSGDEMTAAMEMDDTASVAMLRIDRLEGADGDDGVSAAWKFSASAGGDFDKLLVRSEGERAHGEFERSDAEALWSHAVASYWDTQIGVRRDFGRGADRTWAAIGVQGLAPYWFEIGATAYVGDAGRTALRLEVDYDLSLTQRLILQPRLEINAYGKSDAAAHIGSGVSDAALGLRLRYEVRREIAPYVGIERSWLSGDAADLARADGQGVADTKWVAGLRIWY
jgi:copper resistance protein B